MGKIDNLPFEIKARDWLEKLIAGGIDLKTYKIGLDVLLPNRMKDNDIGYV